MPCHLCAVLGWLATQDRRLAAGGGTQTRIHDDDRLRTAIRDLIDGTRQPASPGRH